MPSTFAEDLVRGILAPGVGKSVWLMAFFSLFALFVVVVGSAIAVVWGVAVAETAHYINPIPSPHATMRACQGVFSSHLLVLLVLGVGLFFSLLWSPARTRHPKNNTQV